MRGKVHFDKAPTNHDLIIIDELPYQVNKANLVAKIGELVATKKLDGIIDITDESNKNVIRVSIKLKK
jgi:DNA gyrase subunit A